MIGIVETGQVVMDERGAVQELDRRRGRIGGGGLAVAAGHGDGQRQPRPDPRAAGKDGIAHRLRQKRRAVAG